MMMFFGCFSENVSGRAPAELALAAMRMDLSFLLAV